MASQNEAAPPPGAARDGDTLSFAASAWIWLKIGLLSFGGPAGQIALMQNELVDRRRVVSADSFQRGLSFSMLLPGPEAQQLATWLGWRTHGLAGGLFAGLAFILPGAALMILLSWVAAAYGRTPLLSAIFAAVAPVVVVIVAQALWKIGQRALGGPAEGALALLAFVSLYFLGAPFPLIVLLAGVVGWLALKGPPSPPQSSADAAPGATRRFSFIVVAAFGALIALVFLATRAAVGAEPFDDVAELFTTAAFVTFGGAYAVLPFVAERAVETYDWLSRGEMVNGLALAESTPGPLILVNVYAGFFAGWNAEGGSAALGALTGALACFYTFAPSFMLILAAAPYVERLQDVAWARRALAGVSAAVVGVIANLAVYLGEAALAPPALADDLAATFGLEPVRVTIAVAAAVLAFGFGLSMIRLVALGAGAGIVLFLLGVL